MKLKAEHLVVGAAALGLGYFGYRWWKQKQATKPSAQIKQTAASKSTLGGGLSGLASNIQQVAQKLPDFGSSDYGYQYDPGKFFA